MEIRFCDRCSESVPDSDFDSGRAVTVDGRHYHVSCALTRSLALGGPRSWLTFLLAVYAAGVTTFLLIAALGRSEDPARVPAAVETRIEEVADHVREQVRGERDALLASSEQEDTRRRIQDAKDLRGELRQLVADQRSRIEETDQLYHANFTALKDKIGVVEREVSRLYALLQGTIDKLEAEAARRTAPPPAPPPEPEPAPAPEPAPPPTMPTPTPAGPRPGATDPEHEAEVTRWLERLKDPNENIRFSATLELGRLKDLRAAGPLVEVLEKDKDYYVRLGAATALGDMKACDAVLALVDALDDRDTLVRTAANDALQAITGHAIEFLTEMSARDRRKVMKEWREWWKTSEAATRARLGQ